MEEEPGGLQSMGSLRVRLSEFTFHFHALEKEMATHSSILAWRIPGMGEPGGQPSMGSHRVGHNWSNLAVAAGIKLRKKSTDTLLKSLPPVVRVNRRKVPIYNRNNKIPNINLARNVLHKHTYVFCVLNSKNIWNWYYFKLKKKKVSFTQFKVIWKIWKPHTEVAKKKALKKLDKLTLKFI